jgi:DNA (cytosine-5)-methyltransferase 1
MRWETVAWVEINPFCQKILKQHFPNAKGHDDIKTFSGESLRGSIDIITGGFPCQPYSTAGKRLGKEDDRHLWPEMLRVIREVQPRYVVGENVRGLTNWSGGLVFDEVQADLEAEGYEVLPFLLPACAVNAPHRRDRIWFIAHAGNVLHTGELDNRRNRTAEKGSEGINEQERETSFRERIRVESLTSGENVTNTSPVRLQGRINKNDSETTIRYALRSDSSDLQAGFEHFPTQPPICGGNDVVPNRVDRIKALGNSVVPQLVYEIFKAIEQT